MTTDSTRPTASSTAGEHFLCDDWFDPLENGVRTRIRGFIEDLLEAELAAALGRGRYERPGAVGEEPARGSVGSRHGHRERSLLGNIRRHDGQRAARPSGDRRRQDEGMAEHDHPRLPEADETGRRFDRGRVSFGDQHEAGAPRAVGAVRRRVGQGHERDLEFFLSGLPQGAIESRSGAIGRSLKADSPRRRAS